LDCFLFEFLIIFAHRKHLPVFLILSLLGVYSLHFYDIPPGIRNKHSAKGDIIIPWRYALF
ncbi:hypothetical protein, partial [Lawsonibacter hominis]|uniref:hypothetical protein n=1 Tax=Lawsonibacter hominis TaxID=2763053 RepID=UPI001A9BDAD7